MYPEILYSSLTLLKQYYDQGTTACILKEGEELGRQLSGAVHICKQFKLRKCGHEKPVSAQECIRSMIGNF